MTSSAPRLSCLVSAAFLFACGANETAQGGVAGGMTSSGGATSGASGTPSTSGGAPSAGSSGSGSAGTAPSGGGPSSAGAGGSGAGGSGAGGSGAGGGSGANAGGSAGSVSGSGNAGSSAGAAAGGSGGVSGSTLPAVTDYTKAGPFATTVDTKVGPGNGYTVYRPKTLGENGFKHSPIIFGPGIGQAVTVHATLLTNFASHGYVVVGTPVLNGGPGDAGNLKLMEDGLNWILAQNDAAGVYQGKLDVNRAVSMGYSVGGTSAVQLGGHKAVATTVSIHGHTAKSAMHGPLLQTTGTKDTVGMPLQQATYTTSEVQTFLATLTGADHGYIQNAGGGEERPAIVAWLRYWLNGDQGAKHYFFGDDCVLCKAPWESPKRKNWQ